MQKLNWYLIVTLVFFCTLISATVFAEDLFYDLTISIADNFFISGNNRVSITNTSSANLRELIIQLPLNMDKKMDPRTDPSRYDYSYPKGFEESATYINEVKSEGRKLEFSYIDEEDPAVGTVGNKNYAIVLLPNDLPPGKLITFDISFSSIIPTKLGNGKYNGVLYLQGMWYPTIANYTQQGVFQRNNEHFKQATYKITVASSPNLEVVTGTELITIQKSGSAIIREGTIRNPISLLPLFASEKIKKFRHTYKNLVIDSYYLPGDEAYASFSIQVAERALNYYKDFYKLEFPSTHLSIVDNYMGSQSAYSAGNTIFMPRELRRLPSLFSRIYEVILAHEFGHMWWGLTVSYGFNEDNWIGEGLCTFFMNKYFENRYGISHNLLNVPKGEHIPNYTFEEFFTYLPYRELAVRNQDPPPSSDRKKSSDISALVTMQYQKGFYIFNILYQELGDKKFIELLHYLLNNYSHKILTTSDLLEAISKVSGKDYSKFFEQWVYSGKTFDYEITSLQAALNPSFNVISRVNIKNSGDINAPMVIQATDSNNNVYIGKSTGKSAETIEFITSSPIKEVILDPNRTYPDIYRLNNYYPTRFKAAPYIAVPESDAYYLSIRPSFVISNLGSYSAVQLNYGYLDDFNLSLDNNSQTDYWQVSYMKTRLLDPKLAFFSTYRTLRGIQNSTAGFNYYWNHVQEQITYPGTFLTVAYQSEDLYKFVLQDKFAKFYGFYSYLDLQKTSHANKLIVNFAQKYGLTPLSNSYYSIDYEYNRKFLGSDHDFDQTIFGSGISFRAGHLKSITVQNITKLSKGFTPEEKFYYLYSTFDGLRAVSRYRDTNDHNKNFSLFRTSFNMPLAANLYDIPVLSSELWLESIYFSLFHEWGALSDSPQRIFNSNFNKTIGFEFDFNVLSFGQFPISLNLIWARAVPNHNAHKEPIYFTLGINSIF
ncbi:MAG: hypothetical protein DKM50_02990 [Candidatus Margulisiibacteriota bacterium]|nr:MAG: hypothetical protein A2X43_09905 [Candidatus Margulisbacteria bacterium GWD2_39_127]OGI04564.1 MAG: hypothetical protein A2X42_07625 [Candidatus Margulisbacteria bacterium GWF2_38_17]OGI11903.1 MAG: hypothetical protein A2X41_11640 [Candidatus Margulisbacteria bacterium GWE2_39_32]PZM83083.1 MAG: hypothetical protein DKM50_02990 [Candidatus Margulisiibacteriota bacterium]HAR62250.1 hypothetical protein [Candidatus Margulisiibacteriota bacterium]